MIEPSYFRTWYVKMYELLWDEFKVDVPVAWPNAHTTMNILTKWPIDTAFDVVGTSRIENINDIIDRTVELHEYWLKSTNIEIVILLN